MLKEDGVGAGPTAPEATEKSGKKEEGKAGSSDGEEENPEILRGQCDSKKVEFAVANIQKDGRRPVDGNPGQGHVNNQEKHGENLPCQHKSTGYVGRV